MEGKILHAVNVPSPVLIPLTCCSHPSLMENTFTRKNANNWVHQVEGKGERNQTQPRKRVDLVCDKCKPFFLQYNTTKDMQPNIHHEIWTKKHNHLMINWDPLCFAALLFFIILQHFGLDSTSALNLNLPLEAPCDISRRFKHPFLSRF